VTSWLAKREFCLQPDWYQNIKAAGTCRIRLGGEQLTLGAPALVPVGQATKDVPWLFGFALRPVVHTAERVQLPILHSSPAPAMLCDLPAARDQLPSPGGCLNSAPPARWSASSAPDLTLSQGAARTARL